MHSDHKMKIFACTASRDFAAKVVQQMNDNLPEGEEPRVLGSSEVTFFSDGEFQPTFVESVRGAMVFIIQSTFPPSENLPCGVDRRNGPPA